MNITLNIALPKDLSLTTKSYQRLTYYKGYGIANMLRNNWSPGYCQSNEEPNIAQMSIQNLSGLYIMVSVGVVVALIDFSFIRINIEQ